MLGRHTVGRKSIFRNAINDVHVGLGHSVLHTHSILLSTETTPGYRGSLFYQELEELMLTYTANDYRTFRNSVVNYVSSRDLLLFWKNDICEGLLLVLKSAHNATSLYGFLRLAAVLCADLGEDFAPFWDQYVEALLDLLNDADGRLIPDATRAQQLFLVQVSFLRDLFDLVQRDDTFLTQVFKRYLAVMDDSRAFVTRLAAEVLGTLVRRLRSTNTLVMLLLQFVSCDAAVAAGREAIAESVSNLSSNAASADQATAIVEVHHSTASNFIGHLFAEVLKGVNGQLNSEFSSRYESIFAALDAIRGVTDGELGSVERECVIHAGLVFCVKLLLRHTSSKSADAVPAVVSPNGHPHLTLLQQISDSFSAADPMLLHVLQCVVETASPVALYSPAHRWASVLVAKLIESVHAAGKVGDSIALSIAQAMFCRAAKQLTHLDADSFDVQVAEMLHCIDAFWIGFVANGSADLQGVSSAELAENRVDALLDVVRYCQAEKCLPAPDRCPQLYSTIYRAATLVSDRVAAQLLASMKNKGAAVDAAIPNKLASKFLALLLSVGELLLGKTPVQRPGDDQSVMADVVHPTSSVLEALRAIIDNAATTGSSESLLSHHVFGAVSVLRALPAIPQNQRAKSVDGLLSSLQRLFNGVRACGDKLREDHKNAAAVTDETMGGDKDDDFVCSAIIGAVWDAQCHLLASHRPSEAPAHVNKILELVLEDKTHQSGTAVSITQSLTILKSIRSILVRSAASGGLPSVEICRQLYAHIVPNLSHWSAPVRITSLEIIQEIQQSLFAKTVPRVAKNESYFSSLWEMETTDPLTSTDGAAALSRRVFTLNNIQFDATSGLIHQTVISGVARGLLGALHIKFKDLWEPAVTSLGNMVKTNHGDVASVLLDYAETWLLAPPKLPEAEVSDEAGSSAVNRVGKGHVTVVGSSEFYLAKHIEDQAKNCTALRTLRQNLTRVLTLMGPTFVAADVARVVAWFLQLTEEGGTFGVQRGAEDVLLAVASALASSPQQLIMAHKETITAPLGVLVSHSNIRIQQAALECMKIMKVQPYSKYYNELRPFCCGTGSGKGASTASKALSEHIQRWRVEDLPDVDRRPVVSAIVEISLPRIIADSGRATPGATTGKKASSSSATTGTHGKTASNEIISYLSVLSAADIAPMLEALFARLFSTEILNKVIATLWETTPDGSSSAEAKDGFKATRKQCAAFDRYMRRALMQIKLIGELLSLHPAKIHAWLTHGVRRLCELYLAACKHEEFTITKSSSGHGSSVSAVAAQVRSTAAKRMCDVFEAFRLVPDQIDTSIVHGVLSSVVSNLARQMHVDADGHRIPAALKLISVWAETEELLPYAGFYADSVASIVAIALNQAKPTSIVAQEAVKVLSSLCCNWETTVDAARDTTLGSTVLASNHLCTMFEALSKLISGKFGGMVGDARGSKAVARSDSFTEMVRTAAQCASVLAANTKSDQQSGSMAATVRAMQSVSLVVLGALRMVDMRTKADEELGCASIEVVRQMAPVMFAASPAVTADAAKDSAGLSCEQLWSRLCQLFSVHASLRFRAVLVSALQDIAVTPQFQRAADLTAVINVVIGMNAVQAAEEDPEEDKLLRASRRHKRDNRRKGRENQAGKTGQKRGRGDEPVEDGEQQQGENDSDDQDSDAESQDDTAQQFKPAASGSGVGGLMYDFELRLHCFNTLIEQFKARDGSGRQAKFKRMVAKSKKHDAALKNTDDATRELSEAALCDISFVHTLLAYNLIFFVADKNESIRNSATACLRAMLVRFGGKDGGDEQSESSGKRAVDRGQFCSVIVEPIIMSHCRRGLVHRTLDVRNAYMRALGSVAGAVPWKYPSLASVYSNELDASFYHNIVSSQHKLKMNALKRLRRGCSEGLAPRDITRYFVPYLFAFVKDFATGRKHHLEGPAPEDDDDTASKSKAGKQASFAESVLRTCADISVGLPWGSYFFVLRLMLRNARESTDVRNVVVKGGLLPILDGLPRFLAASGERPNEDSQDEDDDDVGTFKGKHNNASKSSAAQAPQQYNHFVMNIIDTTIIPALFGLLAPGSAAAGKVNSFADASALAGGIVINDGVKVVGSKDRAKQNTGLFQPSLCISLVKTIKLLPDGISKHIPPLITELAVKLRTKHDKTREKARAVLLGVVEETGTVHLPLIVNKMHACLVHGYQIHVFGYTLVYLLKNVEELLLKDTSLYPEGQLPIDRTLDVILDALVDDYLGETGAQKDAEELASSHKEITKSRALDGFYVLGKVATPKKFLNEVFNRARVALSPFSAGTTQKKRAGGKGGVDLAFVRKVRDVMLRAGKGALRNPNLSSTELINFCTSELQSHTTFRADRIREIAERDGTRKIRGDNDIVAARRLSAAEQSDKTFLVERRPERVDMDFATSTALQSNAQQKQRFRKGAVRHMARRMRQEDAKKRKASGKDGGEKRLLSFAMEDPSAHLMMDTLDEFCLRMMLLVIRNAQRGGVPQQDRAKANEAGKTKRNKRRRAMSEAEESQNESDEEEDESGKDEEEDEEEEEEEETAVAAIDAPVDISKSLFDYLEGSDLVRVVIEAMEGEGSDGVICRSADILKTLLCVRQPTSLSVFAAKDVCQALHHSLTSMLERGGIIRQKTYHVYASLLQHPSFAIFADVGAYIVNQARHEIIDKSPYVSFALTALSKVIRRNILIPEVYDVMTPVTELMLHWANNPTIVSRCRAVLTRFLTEYKLTREKLESHLRFYLRHLKYPVSNGRAVIAALIKALIYRFPGPLLQELSIGIFTPLVATLTGDESSNVQEAAADAIKTLVLCLLQGCDDADGVASISKALSSWLGKEEAKFDVAAMQVLSTAVLPGYAAYFDIVEQRGNPSDDVAALKAAMVTWFFPAVVRIATEALPEEGQSAESAGDGKAGKRSKRRREENDKRTEQLKSWQALFYALRGFEVLANSASWDEGSACFGAVDAPAAVLLPHIGHAHPWVRAVANRLLSKYLTLQLQSGNGVTEAEAKAFVKLLIDGLASMETTAVGPQGFIDNAAIHETVKGKERETITKNLVVLITRAVMPADRRPFMLEWGVRQAASIATPAIRNGKRILHDHAVRVVTAVQVFGAVVVQYALHAQQENGSESGDVASQQEGSDATVASIKKYLLRTIPVVVLAANGDVTPWVSVVETSKQVMDVFMRYKDLLGGEVDVVLRRVQSDATEMKRQQRIRKDAESAKKKIRSEKKRDERKDQQEFRKRKKVARFQM